MFPYASQQREPWISDIIKLKDSKVMPPKRAACGRTGYTGPTGRTGPRHDPPDPSAYSTHTSLAQLAS